VTAVLTTEPSDAGPTTRTPANLGGLRSELVDDRSDQTPDRKAGGSIPSRRTTRFEFKLSAGQAPRPALIYRWLTNGSQSAPVFVLPLPGRPSAARLTAGSKREVGSKRRSGQPQRTARTGRSGRRLSRAHHGEGDLSGPSE
jgi:hypothetical protein